MQLSVILIACACYAVGFYFYCRGFLLTRQTLTEKSNCNDVQHPSVDGMATGCWVPARYDKALLIIIDALRFDFVQPVDPTSAKYNPHYHNRLTVVHRALAEQHSQSLLATFVADPPTTTMQRLKGLTTGSLPTFIDAGSNFAGSEVEEDNWVDQLVQQKQNITFMGDDTWTHLFPDKFKRSYPFPSFDVKDLHTVDNGVLAHLYDEIARPDWTLLIAHFLGVDHCGHKYGPNHVEMGKKLDQMNAMLERVMSAMDDDTILFVLGDHGMTETGDHGGDSANEVDSALFVYSKRELHQALVNTVSSVAQIDLVPTLCLLLDVPVPYSNLGVFIQQLFITDDQLKRAADANVWQVLRYAATYSQQLGSDSALSQQLLPVTRIFNSLQPDEIDLQRSRRTLQQIQHIFRMSWAKFHDGWMALGVCALLETLLWSCRALVDSSAFQSQRRLLKFVSILVSVVCVCAREESVPPLLGLLLLLQVAWDSTVLINTYVFNTSGLTPLLLCAFNCQPGAAAVAGLLIIVSANLCSASALSNSYVVHAASVFVFVSQSLVALLLLLVIAQVYDRVCGTRSQRHKPPNSFRQVLTTYIGSDVCWMALACFMLLRLSSVYWRCREEQHNCLPHWTTAVFGSLSETSGERQVRFLLAIGSLLSIVAACVWYLKQHGHLSPQPAHLRSVWLTLVPWLLCVCCVLYWVGVCWLPESVLERYSTWLQFAPPLAVYATTAVYTVWHWLSPVLVHVVQRSGPSPVLSREQADQMPAAALYKHLASTYADQQQQQPQDRVPIVFGLATLYTGSYCALGVFHLVCLCLLLGDGLTSALVQFLFTLLLTLQLLNRIASHEHYVLLAVSVWTALLHCGFYWLCHQPTFTSIPWDAAFVGLPGNFQLQWAQAALVVINCEAACIVCAFSLPLIIIWPELDGRFQTTKPNEAARRSEYSLLQQADRTWQRCAWATLLFITLNAIIVVGSTLASWLHRRHLMLWKIFAPALIFAWASFAVCCVAAVLGLLFVRNIHAHQPNMVVLDMPDRKANK